MTAIATANVIHLHEGVNLVRSATAQADTGQVDWLGFPSKARYAQFFLNLTALGGTTRVLTPSFLVPDPSGPDDALNMTLAEHAGFTGITAINQYVFDIGPGVTGIANDVTNSATADSWAAINAILPPILGLKTLLDRGDADETYTYRWTVTVRT